jgi:DNA-binding beta-propeller fold protein YncE
MKLPACLRLLVFGIAIFSSIVAAFGQNQPPPLKQVGEFQFPAGVKGRLDHLGIDIEGKRLFVVGEEAHTVLVFDLNTGNVLQQIAIDHPHAVLYRNDLQRIYITDEGKGAVNVYDGKTYKLLQTVPLKVDADSIGYDPATHNLYAVNGGDNAHEPFTMLSVVDTTGAQKLADIKIDGDTLEAMALEKMGNKLYLDNPAKNAVDVIDRKTNKMIAAWPVKLGKDNSTMALDEPAHRLFVGCRVGQLVVIDTQTGKELQALKIGPRADDLAFDVASKRIYAISGGEGAVDVYRESSPDHYEMLGKVTSAPGAKTGLWVPELKRLFVAAPAQGTVSGAVRVYQPQ